MQRQDIRVGDELIYSGGPVEGGWFTVICRIKVLMHGKSRVQVEHLNGKTPGKRVWVSHEHLSAPKVAIASDDASRE